MVNGAAWDYWVPKFFERHCPTKATLDRYEDAWKWVALWLQNNRIHSPRQLTYRLGIDYLEWRTTFKKRTGKIVGRNTAILELKLLSLVMGEAVRLGHADANPLVSMKIRRDRQPKKPELTDDEILEIQEALRDEPEWMQASFEIGLHTGCRLRETRIPLSCVDFRECKITFPSPKGGEVWAAGTTRPVKWSTNAPKGNVRLDLLKGGMWLMSISTSATNSGSYDWSIPSTVAAGNDYQVRATDTTDGTLTYSFVEAVKASHPYYEVRLLGGFIFFSGMLIMAYNVIRTVAGQRAVDDARIPAVMLAHA